MGKGLLIVNLILKLNKYNPSFLKDSLKDERFENIDSIRADRNQVWIPEIEVINRVDDLSTNDDKNRKLEIKSNGEVRYNRSYRIKSMLILSLWDYPFDVQEILLSIKCQF